MDKWYLSLAIIVTLLTVQASAFTGNIFFSSDRFIGSTVTIQCSWVPSQGDVLSELYIGVNQIDISSIAYIYKVVIGSNQTPVKGNQYSQFNNRPQEPSVSGTSAFMNISGLLCTDERNFTCLFVYSQNGQAVPNPSDSKLLDVSLRPDTPEINQIPGSNEVQEHTNFTVTCTAAFGRPGVGKFEWKVYRNGVVEIIPSGDPRIGNLVDANPQATMCSQRKGQTFSMQLTRRDQNLMVACFVNSTAYPRQTPDVCQNTTSDLCQVTNTKDILYGVSVDKMNISMEPYRDKDFYQGENVTLTCYADGNPPPTYYWTMVDGENNTFSWNGSTLVLSNLNVTGTEGVTYNCTATNKVLAAPATTATTSRTITVVQTTTPSTTTTTTTTTTASSSTSGKPGDNTAAPKTGGSDDNTTTIIIIVVVVVGVALIIAIIIIIICCRRHRSKGVEGQRVINRMEHEHPEKAYNNRTNPSYQGSQPDLVSDKKMQNQDMTSKSSLNGSITKEDGLMYADLTYDNRPRSRKPMAITDSSSDYSDIHVPQV